MKTKNLVLLFLTILICTAAQAQQKGNGQFRFNMDEYKKKQALHLKQELNLTESEARAFIPLANEFVEKKFLLNVAFRREARALRDKPNTTDAEYKKAIENYLSSRTKEVELEKEYYAKFKTVLPISKVYKFERVNRKFMESAVNEYKEQRRSERKK